MFLKRLAPQLYQHNRHLTAVPSTGRIRLLLVVSSRSEMIFAAASGHHPTSVNSHWLGQYDLAWLPISYGNGSLSVLVGCRGFKRPLSTKVMRTRSIHSLLAIRRPQLSWNSGARTGLHCCGNPNSNGVARLFQRVRAQVRIPVCGLRLGMAEQGSNNGQ